MHVTWIMDHPLLDLVLLAAWNELHLFQLHYPGTICILPPQHTHPAQGPWSSKHVSLHMPTEDYSPDPKALLQDPPLEVEVVSCPSRIVHPLANALCSGVLAIFCIVPVGIGVPLVTISPLHGL